MWNVFKGALATLVRNRELFVWALAFPLLLSTMFMFMFANLDDAQDFNPVPTGIVEDEAYADNPAFATIIDTLAKPGDDQLLSVQKFANADDAKEALVSGEVAGMFWVDPEGVPELAVGAEATMGMTTGDINRSILKTVADTYVRNSELMGSIAAVNPLVFTQPDVVEQAFEHGALTEQVSLTRSEPVQSVRFFYALFGMAALFGAQIGLVAICATQPNLSALGARRAIGAISRSKTLAGTLAASWLLSFVCLVVAFLYVRFVIGVDFAGREAACIAALVVASLFSTAFGTALGTLPKTSLSIKVGILTGLTCFLSLFAGLYGEPCMQLADEVARNFPVLAALNPAKVITDAFYCLYYYDSLAPFAGKALTLVAMAAVLFGLSALFMRRQRYASL